MKNFSFIVILFICTYTTVKATIVPVLDLPEITRQSAYILAARVSNIQDKGRFTITIQGNSYTGHKKIAELQVVRIIKGESNSERLFVEIFEPDIFLAYKTITINQFGLFFLKKVSENALTVTSPYYPSVSALPKSPAIVGSDVLNQVFYEISSVLKSSNATVGEQIKAIQELERIKTPVVIDALHYASENKDKSLKFQAIAALLRRNDISHLEEVESLLRSEEKNVGQAIFNSIVRSMGTILDPKAVSMLSRVSKSKNSIVRKEASNALRHIGGQEVVPALIALLYDQEREVRYHAVMGLTMITQQYSWGPSVDLYESDEEKYLGFWRKWAKER